MSSNTRFVKLVTGEIIIGTYNENKNTLEDIALIQVIPGASGVQIALVPYGFPFEEKITGSIDMNNIIYEFENIPSDLESKYLQAKSNITISSNMPDNNPLGGSDKVVDLENLFKNS